MRGLLFISHRLVITVFARVEAQPLVALRLHARERKRQLVDQIYTSGCRRRGPKIVAIGGGTGLPTLLRGLKELHQQLTAIVTVGGRRRQSSGRLRRELGVLPPGDIRNCIAALADAEPLMTRLFQYRFGEKGDGLARPLLRQPLHRRDGRGHR